MRFSSLIVGLICLTLCVTGIFAEETTFSFDKATKQLAYSNAGLCK
jgi:hypothetical protein